MVQAAARQFRRTGAMIAMALLAASMIACSGSDSQSPEPPPSTFPAPTSTSPAVDTSSVAAESTQSLAPLSAPADENDDAGSSSGANTNNQVAGESSTTVPGTGSSAPSELSSDQIVKALEEVLLEVYQGTLPSVVYIRYPNPAASALLGVPGVPDDLIWGAGSGFVWDDQGHIVTNHHVVEDVIGVSDAVTVTFPDSTQAMATVVGSDPYSDLAVLKLEGEGWGLLPAVLGDSDEVKVGQMAVAIGAPFGQEFTMTSGIVSGVGRMIRGEGQFTVPKVIQTDAAINPGNSGGPLLDRHGRVIGINTQILSRTGDFSGVGMAVPVNLAARIVPHLIDDGEFRYPWLGVSISAVTASYANAMGLPEETRGALIAAVVEGSPAERSGLRASDSAVSVNGVDYPAGGDIVIAIDSMDVRSSNDLIAHLTYHYSPGDSAIFTLIRDGEQEEIEVTLGQRPLLR